MPSEGLLAKTSAVKMAVSTVFTIAIMNPLGENLEEDCLIPRESPFGAGREAPAPFFCLKSSNTSGILPGPARPPIIIRNERCTMNSRHDVMILGTGEAGIYAAYELSPLKCPGARVLVLDQGRTSTTAAAPSSPAR